MKKMTMTGAKPSSVPKTVQSGIVKQSPNTGKGGTVRKGGTKRV
jgi:hypothetical protein